tara:strand:+ start:428 stop:781 length:354 start_codon:yes stop_codon:yes gene_type:complete
MRLLRDKELVDYCKMVGANLRYIRVHRGLTQTKVAQAINVTFQQMQKYEAGANCINVWRLNQLSKYLKFSINDILDPDLIMKHCSFKEKQEAIADEINYDVERKVIGGATYENNKSR